MSAAVVAFFNNKGGVGKTSLVYHLASMYADLGRRVLAADLDPQANLTASFLDEDALERLWHPEARRSTAPARTIHGMLRPLIEGTGDIAPAPGQLVSDNLVLLPGDLELSGFEDELSQAWPRCLEGPGNPRAFRVMSALGRLVRAVADLHDVEIVVIDVGPNLGVINRAALVASDHVVVPLAPDLFSMQGLRNLGPALRTWRDGWADRLARAPRDVAGLPGGGMRPLGYVMLTPHGRSDRPSRAHSRWIARMPTVYAQEVLGVAPRVPVDIAVDQHCLAQVQHYRSLMPLAQLSRRPVFALRPSDGIVGSHLQTTQRAYRDFSTLAVRIARRMAEAERQPTPRALEPAPRPLEPAPRAAHRPLDGRPPVATPVAGSVTGSAAGSMAGSAAGPAAGSAVGPVAGPATGGGPRPVLGPGTEVALSRVPVTRAEPSPHVPTAGSPATRVPTGPPAGTPTGPGPGLPAGPFADVPARPIAGMPRGLGGGMAGGPGLAVGAPVTPEAGIAPSPDSVSPVSMAAPLPPGLPPTVAIPRARPDRRPRPGHPG
ncbi:ParA family protein [Parafrankia discariae]|uniref:ParA family protein n=1 Tax=Parafrankia discariae TaxID=365528 RepID=UPI0006846684|nr:AAA family ATPase [Parafrankia discariae]